MANKLCWECKIEVALINCVDCKLLYCNDCFVSEHSNGLKSHLSREIKTNAIIKDKNFRTSYPDSEFDIPPPLELFSIDNSDTETTEDTFDSVYISLGAKRTPLFETNAISDYESPESLASMLDIDGNERLNIITFIGKPDNPNKPMANEWLLTDGSYLFPAYSESSLVCRASYNSADKWLILNTENMYKGVEKKTEEQKNMLRLLMSLSDVIIFSQTVPDQEVEIKRSTKRDYLRIHDIMVLCQQEFSTPFSVINKKEPQKLAPGLIYLVRPEFTVTAGSLAQSIVDVTGRPAVFESASKIVFYDGERHAKQVFHDTIEAMLDELSVYRNKHSLEDIWLCIRDCKRSITEEGTDPFVPSIPNQWFRCRQQCAICQAFCSKSYDHASNHDNTFASCKESEKNTIFFCKKCFDDRLESAACPLTYKAKGKGENILFSALWYPMRGRVVECEVHGIISDKNYLYDFYGDSLITKYVHEWPGANLISQNAYPMGQSIIDKMSEYSKPINKVVADAAGAITDNFIIPNDWEKTTSAIECRQCKMHFTTSMNKHHCRNCKFVVCSSCFIDYKSLCKLCLGEDKVNAVEEDPTGLKFINYAKFPIIAVKNMMKRAVTAINRPDYWEDDSQAIRCFICSEEFHEEIRPIHHCRACGKCVCDACSPHSKPVEWRYLYEPCRICNTCYRDETWKRAPCID